MAQRRAALDSPIQRRNLRDGFINAVEEFRFYAERETRTDIPATSGGAVGEGAAGGGGGGGGRLGGHVCVGGGAFVSGAPRCVPVITFDSLPPAYY